MTFNEYQSLAKTTAIYPDNARIFYPCLGLAGEVGEICEKVKKHVRDGRELDKDDLTKELGDVLWYLSALAGDLGINLEDVAEKNYQKLKDRMERNVIQGSGDNR
jgi:NTP pyrophosphatase (non-canonical NTP hydrolase)